MLTKRCSSDSVSPCFSLNHHLNLFKSYCLSDQEEKIQDTRPIHIQRKSNPSFPSTSTSVEQPCPALAGPSLRPMGVIRIRRPMLKLGSRTAAGCATSVNGKKTTTRNFEKERQQATPESCLCPLHVDYEWENNGLFIETSYRTFYRKLAKFPPKSRVSVEPQSIFFVFPLTLNIPQVFAPVNMGSFSFFWGGSLSRFYWLRTKGYQSCWVSPDFRTYIGVSLPPPPKRKKKKEAVFLWVSF